MMHPPSRTTCPPELDPPLEVPVLLPPPPVDVAALLPVELLVELAAAAEVVGARPVVVPVEVMDPVEDAAAGMLLPVVDAPWI